MNSELISRIQGAKFSLQQVNSFSQTVGDLLVVDAKDWLAIGQFAHSLEYRLVALWAVDLVNEIQLNLALEKQGSYLILRVVLSPDALSIDSLSSLYFPADRAERRIHDLFGINFTLQLSSKRWLRHQAWCEDEFPLRKNFHHSRLDQTEIRPDVDYPFDKIDGSGVCEIPVGPVHAGIIEPGHFRFHVAGEDIIQLEERLGYVHKGIEKLAEGRDVHGLIRLAGRVSGDSTVAHAWAAAMACEQAAKTKIAPRALLIRAIMLERERIANHFGDIGAICNDVGFSFANFQLSRLRELWQRVNDQLFGHRFMMDCIQFGGISMDLDEHALAIMQDQIMQFQIEVDELFALINDNNSLQDRIETTGILSHQLAKKIGVLGYVARASGLRFDVRHHVFSELYNQSILTIPSSRQGDVAARMKIRELEIMTSFQLLSDFIRRLSETEAQEPAMTFPINVEGVGIVESWRGEIFTYVRFDEQGNVTSFYPRDASVLNWPALEFLVHGNIVPDFPGCNKSINGSYSGHDL